MWMDGWIVQVIMVKRPKTYLLKMDNILQFNSRFSTYLIIRLGTYTVFGANQILCQL